MTDTKIPTQSSGPGPRTERLVRAEGGTIVLTTGGDQEPGWACSPCDSHMTGGLVDGLRVQALVHAEACGRGLDPVTMLSLVAAACRMSVNGRHVDGRDEWEVTCPREACPPLRSHLPIGLAEAAMVHTALHTGNPSPELLDEIDRWCHVVVGDVDDPGFAVFTRDEAAEQIAQLRQQLEAARADAIVHTDPGYGYPEADLTPAEAADRIEALACDAWERENERDDALADVARLQEQLNDRHTQTAAADLGQRIAAHRVDLDRADLKAAVAAAVVGGLAAYAGQPALALTGPAAYAAIVAAALGALTVAAAASVIWPVLAWRTGGNDLADEADAAPGSLAAAALARAEHPETGLAVLDARNRGVAAAVRAKFRRVHAAIIGLGLTGLAAAVAAILA